MKDERPKSRARVESACKSSIFEAPLEGVPERKRKTVIKQNDAGVEGLFGKERQEFVSKNQALVSLAKQQNKKWTPVLQEKTAEQRKREEVYGKSGAQGGGKRGDSALMSSVSDWRNPQQKHT